MFRITKPILMGGILAALYVAGAAMNWRNTTAHAADAGPTVTIGSPLPIPISGVVSAQQSGAWNVGFAGTPNVNVTGLPAVSLVSGASVNIANTQANPAPTFDTDNAIRHAYQSRSTNTCTGQICRFDFGPVPAGHRLVVEHVTGAVSFQQNVSSQIDISVRNQSGADLAIFFAPPPPPSNFFTQFDQPVLVYIDGPQSFFVEAGLLQVGSFSQSGGQEMILTGHLVDCSVNSCASIAQ